MGGIAHGRSPPGFAGGSALEARKAFEAFEEMIVDDAHRDTAEKLLETAASALRRPKASTATTRSRARNGRSRVVRHTTAVSAPMTHAAVTARMTTVGVSVPAPRPCTRATGHAA